VTLWLHVRDPNFFRSVHEGHRRHERPTAKVPVRRINLDAEPCPVVMANGLRGARLSEHHIEEDATVTEKTEAKPPFRVPSMADIARVRPNGLKVISTFAGCGGSSLGYRMAGFKVLWASEFVDAARVVYEANAAKGTVVDGRDIRKVDPLAVLKTVGLKPGELDVLDGSPPCASFSTAGKRAEHWGQSKKYSDKVQRTDDLFFEFVRFLKAMQPKAFVAENVSGLVKGTAKGYFLEILAAMKAAGYRVEARLLDAQWLGVPQTRQRIIFVGTRVDLKVNPAFPKPLPYRYSVRDAIPWIVATGGIRATGFAGDSMVPGSQPAPTIMAGDGGGMNTSQFGAEVAITGNSNAAHSRKGERRSVDRPAGTVLGRRVNMEVEDLRPGDVVQGPEVDQRNAGRSLTDKPAPTVVAGDARKRTPRQFEVRVVPGDRGNRRRREEGKPYGLDEPLTAVLADGGRKNSAQFMVETETDISRQAIGAEYDKLNPGEASEKYFSLVRADAGEPCPTVTAAGGMNSGIACVVHPTEKRKFAIAELKHICAFPDDFALSGSYAQQWERLGRAVPPVMMKAIAEAVRDRVLLPSRTPARSAAPRRRSSVRSTKS
jgi:DNA (cytosine-5)-methyltransferase 1